MKVQELAEGGQCWTRDLAGQTPDCSLLIVIVCFVGVCLSERRGGIWNPGEPLEKQIQVSVPGVWEERSGWAHVLCMSGPVDGVEAQRLF